MPYNFPSTRPVRVKGNRTFNESHYKYTSDNFLKLKKSKKYPRQWYKYQGETSFVRG